MKLAIADPPYPGQAEKHYADHPDFAGEVDHLELLYLVISGLLDLWDWWDSRR